MGGCCCSGEGSAGRTAATGNCRAASKARAQGCPGGGQCMVQGSWLQGHEHFKEDLHGRCEVSTSHCREAQQSGDYQNDAPPGCGERCEGLEVPDSQTAGREAEQEWLSRADPDHAALIIQTVWHLSQAAQDCGFSFAFDSVSSLPLPSWARQERQRRLCNLEVPGLIPSQLAG